MPRAGLGGQSGRDHLQAYQRHMSGGCKQNLTAPPALCCRVSSTFRCRAAKNGAASAPAPRPGHAPLAKSCLGITCCLRGGGGGERGGGRGSWKPIGRDQTPVGPAVRSWGPGLPLGRPSAAASCAAGSHCNAHEPWGLVTAPPPDEWDVAEGGWTAGVATCTGTRRKGVPCVRHCGCGSWGAVVAQRCAGGAKC